MRNVLITGAAGFLGSFLCDRFISEGYYVVGMDNLSTGSLLNIAHLENNPLFRFVNHDITRYINIEETN